MKTMEITEEVSSHPEERGLGGTKRHRNTPCAREKPTADWKKTLQINEAGGKSRKILTLVVGTKPNGKSQLNVLGKNHLSANSARLRPGLAV